MATRMLQRRGTAAEWAANNPILGDGEIGFERDTAVIKIGDGVTAWNDLKSAYIPRSVVSADGDLIVGTGAGAITRLPQGTAGQALKVQADGSGLFWETPATPPTPVLVAAFDAEGDILVGTGPDTFTRLPQGSAGQALKVQADGSGLFWETPPSTDLSSRVPLALIDAAGDLYVGSGDNTVVRLPKGANGTLLTVKSDGTVDWQALDLSAYARVDLEVLYWTGM